MFFKLSASLLYGTAVNFSAIWRVAEGDSNGIFVFVLHINCITGDKYAAPDRL